MAEIKTIHVYPDGKALFAVNGFQFGPVRTLNNLAGNGHLLVLTKGELQDIINGYAAMQRVVDSDTAPDLSRLDLGAF